MPIWIAAVMLGACQSTVPPAAPAPTETASPTPSPSSPLGRLQAPTADDREIHGVVGERLIAGRYSYLRVDDGAQSLWVATTGAGAQLGERVHVQSFGSRTDFESPRLGRRFDRLVFGIIQPTAAGKQGT